MAPKRCFSVVLTDPVGTEREAHGDVFEGGTTCLRGAEKHHQWIFYPQDAEGRGIPIVSLPLQPVDRVAYTAWARSGEELPTEYHDPEPGDNLVAICHEGRRYLIGKVNRVCNPAQASELGDDGGMYPEPYGGLMPVYDV